MALISWKNVVGVGFGIFAVIALYGGNSVWPDDAYRSEILGSSIERLRGGGGN